MTPSICLGKTIDSLTVQQWLSEERALCVKDLHISEYLCLHYYVWEDGKLWRAPDINHIITVFFKGCYTVFQVCGYATKYLSFLMPSVSLK